MATVWVSKSGADAVPHQNMPRLNVSNPHKIIAVANPESGVASISPLTASVFMPRHYHSSAGSRFLTFSHTTFAQSVVMSQKFATAPPDVPDTIVSSPAPHVLLITLNRPKQLNALRREMHYRLDKLFTWFENEPKLRVAIVTGKGRAFCAGADLKEWHEKHKDGIDPKVAEMDKWNDNGFGGLSNRRGKKPIIAAVNGLCLGGGMEMILNADLVLASRTSQFGLPEVSKGVVAIAGALPRLIRIVGRARATEMALTGRMFTPEVMYEWGIVNRVIPNSQDVVEEALRWAAEIASNSPDAVITSREGLLSGWDAEEPCTATRSVEKGIYSKMDGGENMQEGVLSFVERRKPVWKDSKL